ncbi:arabinosyltransferase domain-containing protein [Actinomycetospora straminea]|uniref:Arabinosyltransferase domain-containing protein n=1 Tax=Actinomycetospora straminea TaxID=663607 RepID=A0ABP9E621_9PSEU|nr:arabinosyltransferase domain-containing protein [Actinomycetospora straminea]MDD7934616.1 arabinosyltransferase domain-containing protein [Actinomycetospora straminea]
MSTSAEPDRPPRPTLLLASAVLTLLCAIAFPLAPVVAPVVTFTWPQGAPSSAAALPLMPYEPVALDASVSCAVLAATPSGQATLATTPPGTPPAPVGGLTVRPVPGGAVVTSDGSVLALVPLPAGPCTLTVASIPERTTVALDGRVVAVREGDVRPVVAAVTTQAPGTDGLSLRLQTDTRFQTTPSAVKTLLGVGVLLGLAGMVVAVWRRDGRAFRRPGRVRPRPVDAVVTLALAGWAVVGPATVDDGYIAGILRSRGESGFTGNVYRWLNAPEAPFSWFYEATRAWASLAPGPAASVLWLRVPATVLGVLLWVLLRRHALPRLGSALRGRGATWVAAAAFLAWWAPFGLSLRPEPWLALGVLAVWVCAERAIATRALLPLLAGGVIAGFTVALTPGALLGLAPLLVALPALARAGSGVREGWTRALVVVAGLAVAVLPMAADQSLAGLLEATRVRQLIGGGQPWWQELARYTVLLTPGDVQGGLGARLAVLLTLLAVPAAAWALVRAGRRGVAPAPARRLLAVVAFAPVLLIVSPTKWTLHFGELAGVGTAALTLFVLLWSPRVVAASRRLRGPALVVVLGGFGLVTTLVLIGYNQWAYASAWGVFWNDIPPQILRVPLGNVALPVTIVGTLVLAVLVAVRGAAPRRLARVVAPGALALVLVVVVVALQGGSFLKVTADRLGTFSYGSDALAALRGDPCGLASDLAVETDPRAGLLAPGSPSEVGAFLASSDSVDATLAPRFVPGAPPAVPLTVGGVELPGWAAPAGVDRGPAQLVSGWYALPAEAREQRAPVVVAASGSLARGDVTLEFAASPVEAPVSRTPAGPRAGTAPRDLRGLAPEGATLVRVRATSAARDADDARTATPAGQAPDLPLAVSVPRVPRTVPFDDLVPPGSTALVDWPVAFVFPCLRPPPLTGGTAGIPPWRVTPPGLADAGEIAVSPTTGGPFLTPRLLVDEVRLPVYLDGDPTRDAVGLARWVPRLPLATLSPQVREETVAGWARAGRAGVPVLDTP